MSNFHAYFALKNEQAFAKLLEASKASKQASTPSNSLGKKSLLPAQNLEVDVNAKDWLGRTVLHIACSSLESYALTYIRMLLAHPAINVNVQDTESKWTPLHRALYCGNLSACQLLLKRPDIDTQIRDNEGLSSFDLYNLTLEGTWPLKPGPLLSGHDPLKDSDLSGDLFTWGGNRNATLGHGDSNDRTSPDYVIIPRSDNPRSIDKFIPVQVKSAAMAKLHTAVITNEPGHNLRLCGFGSGGRLGPTKHTLYNLQQFPHLPYPITSVALAQDHSLVLTNQGEVWSWGLNRFLQLGYAIELSGSGHSLGKVSEEPIQAAPRRVIGPLKKEIVAGIAASKIASACWTTSEGDVYTWGTNHGQLGYDSSMQPTQILPRKVTGVQGVISVALSDGAMVCLLDTRDVICFRDDFRFSVSDPQDLPPYIPPFATKQPISKITCCEGVFAALSTRGDVWTYSVPGRSPNVAESSKDPTKNKDRTVVKPQRVWTARRSVDPARDVAVGADGDMIVCTESGHVFTRSRAVSNTVRSTASTVVTPKGNFHRVPSIHRVISVYANLTGAFGALRLNYSPRPIVIEGSTLGEDITTIRPWAAKEHELEITPEETRSISGDNFEGGDDDKPMSNSLKSARSLVALLSADLKARKETKQGLFTGGFDFGADMIIRTHLDIPVHRALLSARSPALMRVFASNARNRQGFGNDFVSIRYINHEKESNAGPSVLVINGVRPLVVLLLLEFFYSDSIPILDTFPFNDAVKIRREINQLAFILEIDDLVVTGDTGIVVRSLTLGNHLLAMFNACQSDDVQSVSRGVRPDVFIELADHKIACHSIILRSRCLFFKYFFEEDAWTATRWTLDRTITVNMGHMGWRGFSYVMKWIYGGEEDTLFDNLDDIHTVQDLIDLIFEVISMASELLLDRLILVCSAALLRYVTPANALPLLARATQYNASSMVVSLQDYIACNLEAILESRFLDNSRERDYDVEALIPALGAFVRTRQAEFSPSVRTGSPMDELMKRHADWLESQDIPKPIVRSLHFPQEHSSPRSVQVSPNKGKIMSTIAKSGSEDCVFPMDETFVINSPSLCLSQYQAQPEASTSGESFSKGVWKSKTVRDTPKVDFKSVMAETAAQVTLTITPKNTPVDPSRMRLGSSLSSLPPQTPRTNVDKAEWSSTVTSPISAFVDSPSHPMSDQRLRKTTAIASTPSVKIKTSTPASSVPASSVTLSPSPLIPAKAIVRRGPNDSPAWSMKPPGQDLSPPVAGQSFAAIQQQQQLDQAQLAKGKKSLREIQEEESAKREEEEFLKWWAAEEKRIIRETETSPTRNKDASKSRGTNNRNRRHKRSERHSTGISKDTLQ